MLFFTGVLCFTALVTTDAFLAPLVGRYHAPLEPSVLKGTTPRMSTGGEDEPLVFRRFASMMRTELHYVQGLLYGLSVVKCV